VARIALDPGIQIPDDRLLALKHLHEIAIPVEQHSGNVQALVIFSGFLQQFEQLGLAEGFYGGTHVNEMKHGGSLLTGK
jgi:hypothetical protein